MAEPNPPHPASRSRLLRALGWALGLGALGAALWFAAGSVDWALLSAVPAGSLGQIAALVVVNLVLSGWLFWSVQRAFPADRPVDFRTMQLLIAGSALLNYLPAVRAGLFGRAAYLKRHHGVALRDSAWVMLVVAAVTVGVFTAVAGPWLVLRLSTPSPGVAHALGWAGCITATLMLVPGLRFALAGLLPHRSVGADLSRVAFWVLMRTGELLASTGRLWLAFGALGSPIGFAEALVLSAAGLLVRLVGLTPAGLGLSEWAVTALSAALTPAEAGVAAAAALLDRAVEVLVVALAGGAAITRLAQAVRGARNVEPAAK